jgi:hypothetical protein
LLAFSGRRARQLAPHGTHREVITVSHSPELIEDFLAGKDRVTVNEVYRGAYGYHSDAPPRRKNDIRSLLSRLGFVLGPEYAAIWYRAGSVAHGLAVNAGRAATATHLRNQIIAAVRPCRTGRSWRTAQFFTG